MHLQGGHFWGTGTALQKQPRMAGSTRNERERCLAILAAHQDLIDARLYLRLWNCMNNPEHDPRAIPDDELPLSGYKPRKKRKK